jgi:hypothetical protein
MSSILDIDLDYFNLMDNPVQRFEQLLAWANCPVSFVVEHHHEAFREWIRRVNKGSLRDPQYILHVDEHHDMMDEAPAPNISNFMYHAMRTWPEVRVHWLVEQAIDSPAIWLSDESWMLLSRRFTWGAHRPRKWPKPQLVSVCLSPQFVPVRLQNELMTLIDKSINRSVPNKTLQRWKDARTVLDRHGT